MHSLTKFQMERLQPSWCFTELGIDFGKWVCYPSKNGSAPI